MVNLERNDLKRLKEQNDELFNMSVYHVTFYEIEKQRCIKLKNEINMKILIIVSRWSLIALRCLRKTENTTFIISLNTHLINK
jgi:hypothetical protein